MDHTSKRQRGRTQAAKVASRRIEAEAYLAEHFPVSATWWAQLRDGKMTATDLAEAVTAMMKEAPMVQAPMLCGDTDKSTVNPEQAVAHVLQRVRKHAIMIAQCQVELSALDTVRDAISQLLAVHQNAQQAGIADLIAAAAERPSIDREVERRSIEILSTGVTRANVIRLKQNADKLWKRPHDWSGLFKAIGRFQIRELPASNGVEHELLPPSATMMLYCRDANAFREAVSGAEPKAVMARVEAELADWITLHYPGPTPRNPVVLAKAWAALIMLGHRAMQENDRRLVVSLPSAWTPGRVMRIESNDQPNDSATTTGD